MSEDRQSNNYRWFILALSAATSALVMAIPFSCMPVLFKEISEDLHLSLVQVGTIWGLTSLAGFFVNLPGGLLGDRFGARLLLIISCVLVGLTGALRGLSNDFLTLAATMFLNSLAKSAMPIIVIKMIGAWFKGRNLATANGVSAMGMGLGLMLGPMLSSTVLSPWLGGWRNVMYFYGAISVLVGVLWLLFGKEPHRVGPAAEYPARVPFGQAISRLVRIKSIWLIGLTIMFRSAGIMGVTGFVPLYLRNRGWAAASADGALASFYAASMLCVVPLTLLSDKLGSRKAILFPALLLTTVSIGLLPWANGISVWVLMVLAGLSMDGFMATASAMVLETEGVGPAYSGTALGLAFTISQIGGVFSPPLGNSLENANPALPFIFWAGISVVGLVTLYFVRETGWRRKRAVGEVLAKSQE